MITSAWARMSASSSRSRSIDAATPRALERVAVARLAEAADEHVVARLEEEDLGLMPRPSSAPVAAAKASLASPERASSTSARRSKRSGWRTTSSASRPQQLGRQVVDDRVADILEQLAGGRLARARQAADDHHVRAIAIAGLVPAPTTGSPVDAAQPWAAARARWRRGRRGRCSARTAVHHAAMMIGLNGSAGRDHDRHDEDAEQHVAPAATQALADDAGFDSSTSTIGNCITSPKARNIVVTKPK
jgi:hypothetical protein